MIHEVDDALRRLIKEQALKGTDVEISLEAPTRDWAARRNAPTVDIYLYDIREDVRRKERGTVSMRDEDGKVVVRRSPPR
ncbi:MAG TPA: Pvc16 family protein, partial [Micromonosporaceae bacterium]